MRITQDMIEVGVPLPSDVYSEDGHLLIRKGTTIYNQLQIDVICQKKHYTNANNRTHSLNPHDKNRLSGYIAWLITHVAHLMKADGRSGDDFVNEVANTVAELIDLLNKKGDALIGSFHLCDSDKYSITRTIQNTIFCILIAQKMKWDQKRIERLAAASLTANIGMYPLQCELAQQTVQLTPQQKASIDTHTQRSVEKLAALGVKDKEWLLAVACHHERLDQSGYPKGLTGKKIPKEARILAIADRYGAAISPRRGRIASNPQEMMRVLLDKEKNKYDQEIVRIFIAEIGVYPPGFTVLLTSGETAIVTQRRSKRTAPLVMALSDSRNTPYRSPVPRDTDYPDYSIVEYQHVESGIELNVDQLWEAA